MLKLARRARGHFVTLIKIRVHLIRVKPGHISRIVNSRPLTNQIWLLRSNMLFDINALRFTIWLFWYNFVYDLSF